MATARERYQGFDGGSGRKDGHSEYGGGDNLQRYPGGESIPMEDLIGSGTVSDRARLMRQAGIEDYDPAAHQAVVDGEAIRGELQKAALAEEKARLDARTNGYASEPDRYVGEDGSAGGSEGLS